MPISFDEARAQVRAWYSLDEPDFMGSDSDVWLVDDDCVIKLSALTPDEYRLQRLLMREAERHPIAPILHMRPIGISSESYSMTILTVTVQRRLLAPTPTDHMYDLRLETAPDSWRIGDELWMQVDPHRFNQSVCGKWIDLVRIVRHPARITHAHGFEISPIAT